MSNPNHNTTTSGGDEQLFLRRALASVEKAERFQRIKQIAVTAIAFPVAYFALGEGVPDHRVAFKVIMVVGLMLAVCTAKILTLINKNTRAILQAIAERYPR
jgi:hypothetical protein